MSQVAVAKETTPRPNPKDVIDRVLEDMERRHGLVSAPLLVQEARDPDHPLHDRFEWNDSVAAEKWRLEQAGNMIRSARYIAHQKEKEAVEVRRWVSIPKNKGTYLSRPKAMRTVDVRLNFIGNKISVLESWCAETVDIKELGELRALILQGLKNFRQ